MNMHMDCCRQAPRAVVKSRLAAIKPSTLNLISFLTLRLNFKETISCVVSKKKTEKDVQDSLEIRGRITSLTSSAILITFS